MNLLYEKGDEVMKKIDWNLISLWSMFITAPFCFFVKKHYFPDGHMFFKMIVVVYLGIMTALVIDEFRKVNK